MKRIIATVLLTVFVLSLLTACGNNNGKGGNNASAVSSVSGNKNGAVDAAQLLENAIKPSKLITLEDIKRITGMEMEVAGEIDKVAIGTVTSPREFLGVTRTSYVSSDDDNLSFSVSIQQDAVMQYQLATGGYDNDYIKKLGGVPYFIKDWKNILEIGYHPTAIEGLGDWAYLTSVVGNSVYIAKDDYLIQVKASYKSFMHGMTSEQSKALDSLILKTVNEAGELAYKRLEAIIGT